MSTEGVPALGLAAAAATASPSPSPSGSKGAMIGCDDLTTQSAHKYVSCPICPHSAQIAPRQAPGNAALGSASHGALRLEL